MSITISTEKVTAVTKYRVRRIEIVAEYEVEMLDRTILLEIEMVVVVPGMIAHEHVCNVSRTIRQIAELVAPDGTTAMQAMSMLIWDNDVQAQAIWDEQERAKEAALVADPEEPPVSEESKL